MTVTFNVYNLSHNQFGGIHKLSQLSFAPNMTFDVSEAYMKENNKCTKE